MRCKDAKGLSLLKNKQKEVVLEVEEMKKQREPRIYDRMSKKHAVPLGSLSPWMEDKNVLLQEAGRPEASLLLGVKARASVRQNQFRCRGADRGPSQPLLTFMREGHRCAEKVAPTNGLALGATLFETTTAGT